MKCDMNMKINMEKLLDDSQTNKPQKVKSSDIKKINIYIYIKLHNKRQPPEVYECIVVWG